MAKSQKTEDVPKAMQELFTRITTLTDAFAQQHLNQEYAQLIRQATAALCRKRPSPLLKGQAKTWAAGITHGIGMANFLFDSSQTPSISASDLYQWFGIAASTGQAKSKLVRDTLNISQFSPEWSLPSRMDNNPLIWMLSVNGLLMDIRHAPLGAQVEAFRKGLIPYIPGHQEDSDAFVAQLLGAPPPASPAPRQTAKTKKVAPPSSPPAAHPDALQSVYVLEVALFSGPVTDEFVEENPCVIRTIEIRGDQTLADLHKIIFVAFDREEEHLYEFQLKGSAPDDPKAHRYPLMSATEGNLDRRKPAGDVATTQIGALGLVVEEVFGYWFDFGDDWWHQVGVLAITQPQPKGKYPRITQRKGASPPQYADF
jgi:hypothetical protein